MYIIPNSSWICGDFRDIVCALWNMCATNDTRSNTYPCPPLRAYQYWENVWCFHVTKYIRDIFANNRKCATQKFHHSRARVQPLLCRIASPSAHHLSFGLIFHYSPKPHKLCETNPTLQLILFEFIDFCWSRRASESVWMGMRCYIANDIWLRDVWDMDSLEAIRDGWRIWAVVEVFFILK